MIKIFLTLALILNISILRSTDDPIKQSIAILESNVGEMTVEMIQLEDGKWKLRSNLDGGRIVKREEIEYFYLDDNFIKPIEYIFSQRILFKKYNASAADNPSPNGTFGGGPNLPATASAEYINVSSASSMIFVILSLTSSKKCPADPALPNFCAACTPLIASSIFRNFVRFTTPL